jgi:hypothetical protein
MMIIEMVILARHAKNPGGYCGIGGCGVAYTSTAATG